MMDFLLLPLVLMMSQPVSGKPRVKCQLSLEHQDGEKPQSFYSPGDHLIGIIATAGRILETMLPFNRAPSLPSALQKRTFENCLRPIFNIQVVNKNTHLLHNLTLGYNIHDNYMSTLRTADALLDILSTGEANVPNYSCGRKDNLLALLDAADVSIQMSTLGGTYKVPQFNDNIASEALRDKRKIPFFHQMLPREGIQYPAIVQLLLHFRWTLIGLFASDTEKGENFMRISAPLFVRNGICVVISQRFLTTLDKAALLDALTSLGDGLSKWRQVNVFVHFTEVASLLDRIALLHFTLEDLQGPIEGKVWILTNFAVYDTKNERFHKYIHSIWNFGYLGKERRENGAFEPHFFVEGDFEDRHFSCSLSKNPLSVKGRRRCTQKAPLGTPEKGGRIPNDPIMFAVIQTLAQALKAAYSPRWRRRRRRKEGREGLGAPRLQPWQVGGPDTDPLIWAPSEKKHPNLLVLQKANRFGQSIRCGENVPATAEKF